MQNRIANLVASVFALGSLVIASNMAWAEDKVLNIYFAGTGNTVDGSYYSDLTRYTSPKFDPELISTLYANDESSTDLTGTGPHYKKFVDGVGTPPWRFLLNLADPNLPGRGWVECLNEAKSAFNSVVTASGPDDKIILNLIGFSRGGVLTMIMARWASDSFGESKIKKINILAYDPVPGHPLGDPLFWLEANLFLPSQVLKLSDHVHQFVAIYARDERSIRFEPVIPEWDDDKTKALLLMLPGSHETLVGNTEIDGHAGAPFLIPDATEPDLIHVSNISRLIAEHLMSGPNWGGVSFTVPLYADADISAGFRSELNSMNTNDLHNLYKDMNFTSFLPSFPLIFTFQGIDRNYMTLGRDHELLVPVVYPDPWVYRTRWSYISPYRHAFEIVWRPFPQIPWVFANPDQVYNLHDEVNFIDNADDWDQIISFREDPTEPDTEAPVPNAVILPDITGQCSVEITNPPKATDNVDGVVVGETTDPLNYTEQGTYVITWTYTDKAGNSTSQTQTISVHDNEPPSIRVTANPDVLWPPNNRLAEVIFTVEVEDGCTADPEVVLTSVVIDEHGALHNKVRPLSKNDDVQGAGIGTADYSVLLRAQRAGYGDGRVYTVTYTATDDAGNSASDSAMVTVSHDMGHRKDQ